MTLRTGQVLCQKQDTNPYAAQRIFLFVAENSSFTLFVAGFKKSSFSEERRKAIKKFKGKKDFALLQLERIWVLFSGSNVYLRNCVFFLPEQKMVGEFVCVKLKIHRRANLFYFPPPPTGVGDYSIEAREKKETKNMRC